MFKNKKGFTLIELVVIIAVLAIIVTIGMPRLLGQTKEANLTKLKHDARIVQDASDRYYVDHNDWPYLLDENGNKIIIDDPERVEIIYKVQDFDESNLGTDPNQNIVLYEIDFDKLKPYIRRLDSNPLYFVAARGNPDFGVTVLDPRADYTKERISKGYVGEPPVEFVGLDPEVASPDNPAEFDIYDGYTISWDGDLDNKALNIVIYAGYGYYQGTRVEVYFQDDAGNDLEVLDLGSGMRDYLVVYSHLYGKTYHFKVAIPEGARQVTFKKIYSMPAYLRGFYLEEVTKNPSKVTDVSSTSTDHSITLILDHVSEDFERAAIFKDGKFIGFSNGKTFIDKPLYSASTHEYEIQAIDKYGNLSHEKVKYTASTLTPDVIFRGLTPAAFDRDPSTISTIEGIVTWEGDLSGKKVRINLKGGSYTPTAHLYIRDKDNNILKTITVNRSDRKADIVIPPEATNMYFYPRNGGGVKDIYILD